MPRATVKFALMYPDVHRRHNDSIWDTGDYAQSAPNIAHRVGQFLVQHSSGGCRQRQASTTAGDAASSRPTASEAIISQAVWSPAIGPLQCARDSSCQRDSGLQFRTVGLCRYVPRCPSVHPVLPFILSGRDRRAQRNRQVACYRR